MNDRSINLIAADVRPVLRAELIAAPNSFTVASLDDISRVLRTSAARCVTVDILGHSTRDHLLLRIGTTVIDMLDPIVRSFFAELARDGVLHRIDVRAVRLLGCQTGVSTSGRRTLRELHRVLRVPVYGALKRLSKTHYTATGFDPVFAHILVAAARLAPRTAPVTGTIDAA